jgi:hypothetical protein
MGMGLRFAWRSLIRHWRKSSVAISSVASATLALLLFEGYMVDVERMYVDTFSSRQMLGDVVVERAGLPSPGRATADDGALDATALARLEGVLRETGPARYVVRFLNFSGQVQGPGFNVGFTGLAFDVNEGVSMRGQRFAWDAFAGEPFEGDADESVLLGKGLAGLVGCGWEEGSSAEVNGVQGYAATERPFRCPGEPWMYLASTESGQANAETLPVRGLTATGFAELDDRLVVMPLRLARRLVDTSRASYVTARAAESFAGDKDAVASWASRIEERMRLAGVEVRATPWREHAFGDLYVRTMEFLGIFRNFVVGVILVVAAMAVSSTFAKTVRERRKETATLRSFGFLPGDLLGLFAVEAAFLGAAGAAFGTVVALGLIPLLNLAGITYDAGFLSDPVPFRVAFAPVHAALIWVLVISLSVAASLLAAWRGLRLAIVDGLRDT